MNTADWLTYLAISPPDMFAGFLGGSANIFWFNRDKPPKPWPITCTIVGGTIAANYLGVLANNYLGAGPAHVGAFLIGLLGLRLVVILMQKYLPSLTLDPTARETDAKPPV
jgi:hypothetical protein